MPDISAFRKALDDSSEQFQESGAFAAAKKELDVYMSVIDKLKEELQGERDKNQPKKKKSKPENEKRKLKSNSSTVAKVLDEGFNELHDDLEKSNIVLTSSYEEQVQTRKLLEKILVGGVAGGLGGGGGGGLINTIEEEAGMASIWRGIKNFFGKSGIKGTAGAAEAAEGGLGASALGAAEGAAAGSRIGIPGALTGLLLGFFAPDLIAKLSKNDPKDPSNSSNAWADLKKELGVDTSKTPHTEQDKLASAIDQLKEEIKKQKNEGKDTSKLELFEKQKEQELEKLKKENPNDDPVKDESKGFLGAISKFFPNMPDRAAIVAANRAMGQTALPFSASGAPGSLPVPGGGGILGNFLGHQDTMMQRKMGGDPTVQHNNSVGGSNVSPQPQGNVPSVQPQGSEESGNDPGKSINPNLTPQKDLASQMETNLHLRADNPNDREKLHKYMAEANIPVSPENEAWCADYVNAALAHQGIAGTKGLSSHMAGSFAKWGQGVAANKAQRGDVMVVKGGPTGYEHVGVFTGKIDKNGNYEMVSGNAGEPNEPRNPHNNRSQWGGVEENRFYNPKQIEFRHATPDMKQKTTEQKPKEQQNNSKIPEKKPETEQKISNIGSLSSKGIEGFMKVREAAKALGDTHPDVTAGQWAIESNWGKIQSGKNNFFGQTATANESGTFRNNAVEGGPQKKYKNFETPEEGVKNHLDHWAKYYKDAKTDTEAIAQIQRHHYAEALDNFSPYGNYNKAVMGAINMAHSQMAIKEKQREEQQKKQINNQTKPSGIANKMREHALESEKLKNEQHKTLTTSMHNLFHHGKHEDHSKPSKTDAGKPAPPDERIKKLFNSYGGIGSN